MNKVRERIQCTWCNGIGSVSNEICSFNDAGERPPQSETCPFCNGKGFVNERYFVEYLFKNNDRTYWFPIFFNVDNIKDALKCSKSIIKALQSKDYKIVNFTKPLKESLERPNIEAKIKDKKNNRLVMLDFYNWKFTDIHLPNLNFNNHIEYVAYSSFSMTNSIVAKVIAYKKYPIRVIHEKFPINWDTVLVDVVDPNLDK